MPPPWRVPHPHPHPVLGSWTLGNRDRGPDATQQHSGDSHPFVDLGPACRARGAGAGCADTRGSMSHTESSGNFEGAACGPQVTQLSPIPSPGPSAVCSGISSPRLCGHPSRGREVLVTVSETRFPEYRVVELLRSGTESVTPSWDRVLPGTKPFLGPLK